MESKYKVVLSSVNSKVSALKALVMVPGITEGSAMNILKSLPSTVKNDLTENEAETIKSLLKEAGCVAEVHVDSQNSTSETVIALDQKPAPTNPSSDILIDHGMASSKRNEPQKEDKQSIETAPKKKGRNGLIYGVIAGVVVIVIAVLIGGLGSGVSQSYLEYVLPEPSWDGSVLTGANEDSFKLSQISSKANSITDVDSWYANNDLEKVSTDCAGLNCFPAYYKNGYSRSKIEKNDGYYFAYYSPSGAQSDLSCLLVADSEMKPKCALDFSSFSHSPMNGTMPWGGDAANEFQSIKWAKIVGDMLYIQHGHNTYASASCGQNAYISAIDLTQGVIKWTTEPLTCNCPFIIVDNTIICGYGFTSEKDNVFLVDMATGKRRQTIKLASGPEIIIQKGDEVYIRTYNRDYVFKMSTL